MGTAEELFRRVTLDVTSVCETGHIDRSHNEASMETDRETFRNPEDEESTAYVTLIFDETGSMQHCKGAAIAGLKMLRHLPMPVQSSQSVSPRQSTESGEHIQLRCAIWAVGRNGATKQVMGSRNRKMQ